jgi:hypothetical protein
LDFDADWEPLTVYDYKVSPPMDKLVRHVLKVIPNKYVEEFPSFSVFESVSPWGAHIERESAEDEGKMSLDPKILKMPKSVAVGLIAHEFAHLFLNQTGGGGLKDEYAADAFASQWGFAKEIKVMRRKLGSPTEREG